MFNTVGLGDIMILNRILELMPCVLALPALYCLLRAAKLIWNNNQNKPGLSASVVVHRFRTDGRLVACLLMMSFEVGLFLTTQVFWLLFLLTDDLAYRVMFGFLRAFNGNVFMVTMIVIGRLLARAIHPEPVSEMEVGDDG